MGLFIGIPLLILAAMLQATWIPLLIGSSASPNLVLLLVLSWAVNADLRQCVIWAFVGGIALDLLSAVPIGTSCIPLLILAILLSDIGERFAGFGAVVMLGLTFVGTIFYQVTMLLLISLLGFRVAWVQELTSILIPTVIYNVMFVIPIYLFVRRLQRRRVVAK